MCCCHWPCKLYSVPHFTLDFLPECSRSAAAALQKDGVKEPRTLIAAATCYVISLTLAFAKTFSLCDLLVSDLPVYAYVYTVDYNQQHVAAMHSRAVEKHYADSCYDWTARSCRMSALATQKGR